MLPSIMCLLLLTLFIERWMKVAPVPSWDIVTLATVVALAVYIVLSHRYLLIDRYLSFVSIGIVLGQFLPRVTPSHGS
jgi:hypothetical protein